MEQAIAFFYFLENTETPGFNLTLEGNKNLFDILCDRKCRRWLSQTKAKEDITLKKGEDKIVDTHRAGTNPEVLLLDKLDTLINAFILQHLQRATECYSWQWCAQYMTCLSIKMTWWNEWWLLFNVNLWFKLRVNITKKLHTVCRLCRLKCNQTCQKVWSKSEIHS